MSLAVIISIILVGNAIELNEIPSCKPGEIAHFLNQCNRQDDSSLRTRNYFCTKPLDHGCVDLRTLRSSDRPLLPRQSHSSQSNHQQKPQPTLIEEIVPPKEYTSALSSAMLKKLRKKCKYTTFCGEIGKNECAPSSLPDIVKQHKAWDRLPNLEHLAYTLYPQGLDHYTYMLPRDKHTDKPFQEQNDIQYHIGHRGDTFVIHFDGTELRRDREVDLAADIQVGHERKELKFGDKTVFLRVHKGISERLDVESGFMQGLSDVLRHYKRTADDSEHWVKHLVISGHSLGGGYAKWFYLRVFGDQNAKFIKMLRLLAHLRVEDITVITYGAPFIIYHNDVSKIPEDMRRRVYSFVDVGDPVPKLLAGFGEVLPRLEKAKRRKMKDLGTNGGFGEYFVIYHQNKNKKIWIEPRSSNDPQIMFGNSCWFYVHVANRNDLWTTLHSALNNHFETTYRERIIFSLAVMTGRMDLLEKQIEYFQYLLSPQLMTEAGRKFRVVWRRVSDAIYISLFS